MRDSAEYRTSSNGTRYQWYGQRGPVIVLIHGLGLNLAMWQWQVPALSKDHRVLCYDLIGHGETPATEKELNLKLFSGQLRQLLDELQVKSCAIIGFSLGGMIARRFAMDYPDYLTALVILNSPHARTVEQQRAIVKRVDQAEEQGPAATVEAALVRWFTDEFRNSNKQVIDLVRQWVLTNNHASYPQSYRVLALGVDELVAPDPPIQCPTLVMTAEDDFGQPAAMASAIAAEIPGAKCIVVPRLRHMGLVEAPEIYNQALTSFFGENLTHS